MFFVSQPFVYFFFQKDVPQNMSKVSWWRHQMETFSALLAFCVGNSPVNGEFPSQRPVTRSFDIFFDLRMNKRLSKQSWCWWFETPRRSLWRHCNVIRFCSPVVMLWVPKALTRSIYHDFQGHFLGLEIVLGVSEITRKDTGEISCYRTTTKHNEAWTVHIFWGYHISMA